MIHECISFWVPPDDVEVACAGTLAKYAAQGHRVIVCHVANGNLGHVVVPPDELRDMRRKEAASAGALAGIEVITCDIGDLLVYDSRKEQRDKVVDVIRRYQPRCPHHPQSAGLYARSRRRQQAGL